MAWKAIGASWRFAGDRRSDHSGKAFDDIHAHNPFAARPIAGDAIPFLRDPFVQCQRGPAGRGDRAKRPQKLSGVAGRLKTPQLKGQGSCRRFEQRREK